MDSIMVRDVPATWRVRKLGQLFAERREKVSDQDFPPLSVTKNGIVPQMEGVAKTDDGGNRKKVCVGDFVINGRSDRKGSSGLSELDGSVSLINIVLQPQEGDPRFLHHLLKSPAFQEEFYRFGHGIVADLWTTRFSDMKGILVALPDLPTQQAIAAFLDRETTRIDQLIAKKERLSLVLEGTLQTLVSLAVTTGLNQEPLKNTDSIYLPQIPKSWTLQRLKQLGQVRGGLTLGRELPADLEPLNVPYLRVANVQAGFLDLESVLTISASASEVARYSLQAGDVLMNEGGDNDKLGRGAVWDASIKPCLHQNHVFAFRPHDPDWSTWISLASNAKYGRDFTYLNSKQSTNLASIAKSKIEQFPIALPPPEVRDQIQRDLATARAQRTSAKQSVLHSITRLREFRAALITAAVTGQLDPAAWQRRDTTARHLAAEEIAP